jgi:hypothetical protein
MILDEFMVWLLSDPRQGVIRFASPEGKEAIQRVANLYELRVKGDEVDPEWWDMARGHALGADHPDPSNSQYFASQTAGYEALNAVEKAANAEAWASEDDNPHRVYHEAYFRMLRKLINLLETQEDIDQMLKEEPPTS